MNKPNISTPSQLSANVFEQLISPIDAFVQQQNADYFHHHNEKLSYAAFFRLLMYYFSTQGESFKVFINTELNRGLVPSNLNLQVTPYTTVSEAFGRFPVAWFQSAYQHLLDTQPLKQIPELAALGTLCCVDGSLFPVINSMQWAEYTSKQQSLKLHLSFELNRMVKCEFWVTSANTSERKMLIKMAKQDTTYIADRGYMSFKVAHQLLQAQAHFIFRVKANLKYQVQKSLPVALPKHVQDLFENVTDEIIRYDNDSFEHTYRLVTFRAENEFFLILTDREDLSTYEIIMLYAYRWQVELLFRFEKRTMNGIHLIKQDKQGVTISVLCHADYGVAAIEIETIEHDNASN